MNKEASTRAIDIPVLTIQANGSNAPGAIYSVSSTVLGGLRLSFPRPSLSEGYRVTGGTFFAYMDTVVDDRGGVCIVGSSLGMLVDHETQASGLQWRSTSFAANTLRPCWDSGVSITCSSSSAFYGSGANIRTDKAPEKPYLYLSLEPVTLTPKSLSPASGGSVYKGFTQRFAWDYEYDNADVYGPVAQSYAVFYYRAPGGTASSIQIDGDRKYIDFDTSLVASTTGMEYSVKIVSNSGASAQSVWTPLTFKATNVALRDLSPRSKVYRGFNVNFTWGINYSVPSGCSGTLRQTSAVLRWRPKGSAKLGGEYNIAGSTAAYTLGGQVLPLGDVEWQVTVNNSSGSSTTSDWISIANTEVAVAIVNMVPISRATVYHGFSVRFSWGISYSLPSGISGNITQTSALLRWRKKGSAELGGQYTIAGAGASYTLDGQALPIGEIEWQLTVTNSTGGSTTSDWVGITNVEVPIVISGMYPAEGARVIKAQTNRFGWTVTAQDADTPGEIVQALAVMRYRVKDGDPITEKTITGTTKYIDFPAGTFAADTLQWQVTVTANTGTAATSDWVSVITKDTLSTPTCVSPVGEIVDDKDGITFAWQHVNETGTAQTAWRLETSINAGAMYTRSAEGEGAADRHAIPRGTFEQGTLLWRVQTRNSDGDWGTPSEPATIIIQRAPETPVITYVEAGPLPTVRWQSADQSAYRLTIGGYDTGWIFGTAKEYRHRDVLLDGTYTVTVTIRTLFELESQPASLQFTIKNTPGAPLQILTAEKPLCAEISWSTAGEYAVYYVLRDGVPIAKTTANVYVDQMAAGKHTYLVRAFDAAGNYTDSPPAVAWSRVPRAAISLLQPISWLQLAVREGAEPPEHSAICGLDKSFVYYYGDEDPEENDGGGLTEEHKFVFAVTRDEFARLFAMRHGTVIYKDLYGDRVIGTMTGIDPTYKRRVPVTFTLRRTKYKERIDYDPV